MDQSTETSQLYRLPGVPGHHNHLKATVLSFYQKLLRRHLLQDWQLQILYHAMKNRCATPENRKSLYVRTEVPEAMQAERCNRHTLEEIQERDKKDNGLTLFQAAQA